MHILLTIFTLLLVTVAPLMVSAQSDQTKEIARRFCIDILRQSPLDTSHCLIKPKNWAIKSADPAVLTYLCCLGQFKDVTYNYMPYVSKDLSRLIAYSPNAGNLLSVGTFIRKCSARKVMVTKDDYDYWRQYGKTMRVCQKPSKK